MLKFPIISILFIFVAFIMFAFFILGNYLINDPTSGLIKTFNDVASTHMSGESYNIYLKQIHEDSIAFGVIAVIFFALAFILAAFESLKSTNEGM